MYFRTTKTTTASQQLQNKMQKNKRRVSNEQEREPYWMEMKRNIMQLKSRLMKWLKIRCSAHSAPPPLTIKCIVYKYIEKFELFDDWSMIWADVGTEPGLSFFNWLLLIGNQKKTRKEEWKHAKKEFERINVGMRVGGGREKKIRVR